MEDTRRHPTRGKGREYNERRTVDPGNRGDLRACEPRLGVVRFSLVPAVHRVCGAEPVPIGVDELVPDGEDPVETWRARKIGGRPMPLYEYRCEKCGQQYESYKRLSEEKKDETCPACGGRAVKMGISLFTAKGTSPGGGSSCGIGPRRSPFG